MNDVWGVLATGVGEEGVVKKGGERERERMQCRAEE